MGRQTSRHPARLNVISLMGLADYWGSGVLSQHRILEVLQLMGYGEEGVRSALYRLRSKRLLDSTLHADGVDWSVHAQSGGFFSDGNHDVFHRLRQADEDGFLLLSFANPEGGADTRRALHREIDWLGFGRLAHTLRIAPAVGLKRMRVSLQNLGMLDEVRWFTVSSFGELSGTELVSECWDLPEIAAQYESFVAEATQQIEISSASEHPLQPLATFIEIFTSWRAVATLDAGLPLNTLPSPWAGERAWDFFDDELLPLREAAQELLGQISDSSGPNLLH